MREVLTSASPPMTTTTTYDQAEPQEFSLTRERVAHVLAMLDAKRATGGLNAEETKAHEVATLRLFGAGASPKKFARLERSRSTACCAANIDLPAPDRLGA